jgi:hypothetical protein
MAEKHVMISRNRIIGILAGTAPFLIVIFCSMYDWRILNGRASNFGYSLFAIGGLVSITNFYFYVLRYPIHRLIHGKKTEYKWISGIPLFGILSVVGLLHFPRSLWSSVLAFLFLLCDVGGIHWFVIFTWKESSLWNPKKSTLSDSTEGQDLRKRLIREIMSPSGKYKAMIKLRDDKTYEIEFYKLTQEIVEPYGSVCGSFWETMHKPKTLVDTLPNAEKIAIEELAVASGESVSKDT